MKSREDALRRARGLGFLTPANAALKIAHERHPFFLELQMTLAQQMLSLLSVETARAVQTPVRADTRDLPFVAKVCPLRTWGPRGLYTGE